MTFLSIRDLCGCGWLRRFNNLGPRPEKRSLREQDDVIILLIVLSIAIGEYF
jgi:hypothetical protein